MNKTTFATAINWGELAKHEGTNPLWDELQSSQNVYCRGEFDGGNKDNNPQ